MKQRLIVNRRTVVAGLGAVTFASTRSAIAQDAGGGGGKLVIVILRGALDGLAAAPPTGEERVAQYRPQLITQSNLPITDGFSLHPALENLHALYGKGEAAVMHAAAGPWRDRSHFRAQDLLESGTSGDVLNDGWLNRAMTVAPTPLTAVSIGGVTPLILRGPAMTTSWSPSVLPEADDDTIARLLDLYEADELLGPALAQAVAMDEDLAMEGGRGRSRGNDFQTPLAAAGRLLTAENGADIAVVSLGGWDTHANQTATLNRRLGQLDKGLKALQAELGGYWQNTMIAVATEFGRTIRQNGTKGTDHGTGGVAFALGGAVAGGRLLGDWPGLAPTALYENRDLYPANDLRGLFKGMLEAQFGLSARDLSITVFPDSASIASLSV